jgi:hypothetical protein
VFPLWKPLLQVLILFPPLKAQETGAEGIKHEVSLRTERHEDILGNEKQKEYGKWEIIGIWLVVEQGTGGYAKKKIIK